MDMVKRIAFLLVICLFIIPQNLNATEVTEAINNITEESFLEVWTPAHKEETGGKENICPPASETFCSHIQRGCSSNADCSGGNLCCLLNCSYVCFPQKVDLKSNLTDEKFFFSDSDLEELSNFEQRISRLERQRYMLFVMVVFNIVFIAVLIVCFIEIDKMLKKSQMELEAQVRDIINASVTEFVDNMLE